jgi:Spy/CpxP family protein refolding chaperone
MKRNFLTLVTAGLIVLGGFSVLQAQNPRGGGAKGHRLEQLTDGLNLTPDQQAKVQPLIDQAKPQISDIRRQAMEKIKSVITSTASQIRPLLTPEQQKKFDENQNARRGRMNARKGPGPRDEMDED